MIEIIRNTFHCVSLSGRLQLILIYSFIHLIIYFSRVQYDPGSNPLRQKIFPRVLHFFSVLKIKHFLIPIRSGTHGHRKKRKAQCGNYGLLPVGLLAQWFTALHRYRRGQGSNPGKQEFFLGFLLATAKVASSSEIIFLLGM